MGAATEEELADDIRNEDAAQEAGLQRVFGRAMVSVVEAQEDRRVVGISKSDV